MNQIIQVTYFLGNFVGTLLGGFVSDHCGRKLCYLLCLALWIILAVTSSQVENLYTWVILRFLCATVSSGYYVASSVYLVEITHGKWRALFVNTLHGVGSKAGLVVDAIMVYLLKDMVLFQLALGLSNFLVLWFIMPESPRWLLAQCKLEKAKKEMIKICEWNRQPTKIVTDFVENHGKADIRRESYADLLQYLPICRNILIMCFSCFASSMGFVGLMYYTPALNWNIILVFAVPPTITLLFTPLESFLQNALGRKFMLTGPLIMTGMLLLLTNILGKDSSTIIILSWTGTVLCDIAITDGFVFTKELFPTNYRTQALSLTSACNKLGAIAAPFIALLDQFHEMLPFTVYGTTLLLAGILSFWIWPETSKIKLPDTLEDSKDLAKSRNTWLSWISNVR